MSRGSSSSKGLVEWWQSSSKISLRIGLKGRKARDLIQGRGEALSGPLCLVQVVGRSSGPPNLPKLKDKKPIMTKRRTSRCLIKQLRNLRTYLASAAKQILSQNNSIAMTEPFLSKRNLWKLSMYMRIKELNFKPLAHKSTRNQRNRIFLLTLITIELRRKVESSVTSALQLLRNMVTPQAGGSRLGSRLKNHLVLELQWPTLDRKGQRFSRQRCL